MVMENKLLISDALVRKVLRIQPSSILPYTKVKVISNYI